ncbi:MAG TPA: adenylosuccinate synthase [Chloroflexota bacterium]|nr:adenylosuccinate synthase [Chloroflexota bacterium]
MGVTAVVGAQWGDEGKGKVVDVLADGCRIVARFGGGSNAGHTVVNEYGAFRLHSLPSGAFHAGVTNVLGTGTVVDFDSLGSELDALHAAGVPKPLLLISARAHVIMPYHRALDGVKDEARGAMRIGTTGRGVGPAYVDKADRVGIQAGELLDPVPLAQKLSVILEDKNRLLGERYHHPGFTLEAVLELTNSWRKRFGSVIADTDSVLSSALARDDGILAEGQLGVMRDLDWGTYPYVTSSTTFAAGAGPGLGIPPRYISDVVGVVKAYTTAVGEGPLPAEMAEGESTWLRERGQEYGATTGRPRRVGWLDAVALRYAARLTRFTRLAVTKLDVLDGLRTVRIVVGYEIDGETSDRMPLAHRLSRARPVFDEVDGWTEDTSSARCWTDLPHACRRYLDRISTIAEAPVSLVGVGSSRAATIRLESPEPAVAH